MMYFESRSSKIVLMSLLSAFVSFSSLAITDRDLALVIRSFGSDLPKSVFLEIAGESGLQGAIRIAESQVFRAMKNNDSKAILELGQDPIVQASLKYMQDIKGWTLLHCAVEVAAKKWATFETLDALLEIGVDINQGDATKRGTTPLEAANYYRAEKVADYLRDNGARDGRAVEATRSVIKTKKHNLAVIVEEEAKSPAGIVESRVKSCVQPAKRQKCDDQAAPVAPNCENGVAQQPQIGFRPVYPAPTGDFLIGLSYEKMIINWIEARDWNAIFLAIATGSLSIDWRDSHGSTLMIYAAHQGNREVIVELIKVGGLPLINIPNASGIKPIMYAVNNQDRDMVNFLRVIASMFINQRPQVTQGEGEQQALEGLLELAQKPQAGLQDD